MNIITIGVQENMLRWDPSETVSLEEAWRRAQQVNCDSIEVRLRIGQDRGDELRAAKAAGVVMGTMCVDTYPYFIGSLDEEKREVAVEAMKGHIALMGEVHPGAVLVTPVAYNDTSSRLPSLKPKVPAGEDDDAYFERITLDRMADDLVELGKHAEGAGVILGIEPLNRYEGCWPTRLWEAVKLAKAAKSPNVQAVGDVFHMFEEEDLHTALSKEVLQDVPLIQLGDTSRFLPGTARFEWNEFFGILQANGYAGQFSLECGIRRKKPESLDEQLELIAKSVAFIRESASLVN